MVKWNIYTAVALQLDVNFVSIPTLSTVQEALHMLGLKGNSKTPINN